MFRREAPRAQEEPIPDDLLASIPVVAGEAKDEFVVLDPPERGAPPMTAAQMAQQLRYDMGEAFARELDRAEQTMMAAISDLERRLAQAEAAIVAAHTAAQHERDAREAAEARLRAFKELALR